MAGALFLTGCVNSEYEMSNGFLNSLDNEITLFQDRITVPVGSVGPFTLDLVLDQIPIFEGLIKTDENGYLLAETESEIYSVNTYETMLKTADPDNPYTWDCGDRYGGTSGIALILNILGMTCQDQTLRITAKNPLFNDGIALQGTIKAYRYGDDWSYEKSLEGVVLSPSFTNKGNTLLASVDIPGTDCISVFRIENLKMDLPGNPNGYLTSSDDQNFIFTGLHRTHLGVGPSFDYSLGIPINKLSVPLGKYDLKKCVAKLELENTLPLDITIDDIKTLKPASGENSDNVEDTNIVITGSVHLAAGSLESPSVTPVELQVEALQGIIPDINSISFKVSAKGVDRFASTPLSTKQGVYIRSSSITVVGGITLDNHE